MTVPLPAPFIVTPEGVDAKGIQSNFEVLSQEAGVGATGPAGAAATVAAGSTTTGAAGSSASVTNSGSSSAAVFNFTIPRGDTGATGSTGAAGAAGSAATIAVGTVTTGAAGSSAVITNAGTSSAATFNFTIPKGDTGATGAAGSNGTNGTNGSAATIAVGTVTTGAAGSSATVTNVGTSSAATFNFSIPKGDTGAGVPTLVSTLPSSPTDGQEVYYQSTAMATAGVVWTLRYRSAASGSSKWEFVGGAAISVETTSSGTRTATTFGDLSANTQEVTVPLAGDYRFEFYCTGTVDAADSAAIMALKFGTTAATDTYSAGVAVPVSGLTSNTSRWVVWPGLAASTAVRAQFRKGASGATATFARHGISAIPVRLG